ncbi:ORC-CDC6 family AAA ATPase [Kordia jejudonensis]|uniref:ORC-CDC6 family AAA ATPase n=1 Tax=Kordia jejudonensis TaxID=1348245 RepID=UPI00062911DC|nr:hypothetical protein [Kordia jejudonensis]
MKEKYSCFNCPSLSDYTLKEKTDKCPKCGDEYGFPLSDHPENIGDIKIIKPLERGFYGSTYVGEISPFGGVKIKKVIKIIPVEIYRINNKDFKKECEEHLKVSLNSNHIVSIDTNFYHENIEVVFKNGKIINCHAIGMDYIEGDTLKNYLNDSIIIESRSIAQIAIDLITLLKELRQNEAYHNDLHPGNLLIEKLLPQKKRIDGIDENIKLIAIDLGSLGQETKSNDDSKRAGDLHWVAECINRLSRKITDNASHYDEKDWRLAYLLEEKADYLKPPVIAQKQLSYQDLIDQIKDTYYQHNNPWEDDLKLKNFHDSVNAQSLRPWYIPNLFVDQDNNWINSISTKGPQVITGMRGCGKTMLLRTLEFHARIVPQNEQEVKDKNLILDRIYKKEEYLGLYVSCVKLLGFDSHDFDTKKEIFQPYSKLFISYALQAIQAVKHLSYVDKSKVRKDYFELIANTLKTIINNSDSLEYVSSPYDLETKLKGFLNSLSDGNSKFEIKIHPKIAFPQLASAIKQASEIFNKSYVFFLLDDVSTRYLSENNIMKLVSELLFQDENCSFKFTTEAQTLEMVIKAPGNNQQAKIGRDYTIFDLGSEVNRIIHKNHYKGKSFIEKVLTKRAKYYPSHPKNISISEILGDKTLISIAHDIVKPEKASNKKDIYTGLTALTAVCIGDLGDVITLYELMLKRNTNRKYPIPPKIQNACFLELCNSRLYDLNRKDSKYLDFVNSFADASHHLLVQSAIKKDKNEVKKLRQYTSIFITISYGDKEIQYKKVRDLIDSGIFNFYGGPEASRTNRQGLNPEQQFKLVFRKLYGVTRHIGLSNADRFELSGEKLFNWLNNPKDGKDILIGNLNPMTDKEIKEGLNEMDIIIHEEEENLIQQQLEFPINKAEVDEEMILPDYSHILSKLPEIKEIKKLPNDISIDNIILGLGFEDATLESARKLSKLDACNLILIEFDEIGKTNEIIEVFKENGFNTDNIIKYKDFLTSWNNLLKGNTVCDITGLPKSIIFDSIRKLIYNGNNVYLTCTEPEFSYPLDENINKVLKDNGNSNSINLLTEVSDLIKGEQGPYSHTNLLSKYTNISEPRVLFSFAPIKHERLYTLLGEREYDKINVVVPEGNSAKERLAQLSAKFSLTRYNNATIHKIELDDLNKLMETLAIDYYTYFILNNFPFEIALTGSKLQSAIVAAFASTFKISQCWYMKPKKWDESKFSRGHKITRFFHIVTK